MSIREARLCDFPSCDNPSTAMCPLCSRDCCVTHYDAQHYVTIGVMLGNSGQHGSTQSIGRCDAIGMCADCFVGLSTHGRVLNFGAEGPLSSLVTPLGARLIEAASAFLAAEKLKGTKS